jgi:hypothetical protein
MRVFVLFRKWPIAVAFFVFHALLLAALYLLWHQSASDPNRDVLWFSLVLFDFPWSDSTAHW